MNEKHVISALVENHSGVLARVSGLISGRGFNIDSLAVGETDDPEVSRMTIVTVGDSKVLDQIVKQLGKLIDVIKIEDIGKSEYVERELLLCKVLADANTRNEIIQIANTFRAKIVDVDTGHLMLEVTGTESKVDALIELLEPFGIHEVARTGIIALSRDHVLKAPSKPKVTMKKVKLSASKKKASKKSKKKVSSRTMAKDGM